MCNVSASVNLLSLWDFNASTGQLGLRLEVLTASFMALHAKMCWCLSNSANMPLHSYTQYQQHVQSILVRVAAKGHLHDCSSLPLMWHVALGLI